ncbi:MAG: bifunctional glutamate N-acetyltransferase/amino-acid acetyltransferase ArgJ [Planctomycetales bacterium]|nr:bifunctional glutamate N-acetyltransferase/amino-acid acetyltransferase ArgJ [Planctomycetales bacterium]
MSELIPLPFGFRAAGIHCGVKKDSAILDLALFVSDRPATSAGVFTTNLVHGAPVKVSRERVRRSTSRAVVINSGNSNACTGDRGITDAKWMTAEVAKCVGCADEDVLVCSTGVIGRFLPREVLGAGIPRVATALEASPDSFLNAARAMMTTDTFAKQSTRTVEIGGRTVRVSGVCKGAAMIAPNMATMLGVILTDATLTPAEADALLRNAVNDSFNCISVEGHMSTSDTVLLLANGAAGSGSLADADRPRIQQAIAEVASELAQAIIRDAEGADHFVTIDVRGGRTRDESFRIAKFVAESPLVKTAIAGADPNWGRIVSAAGYAGVRLEERDISLRVNGIWLYRTGAPVEFDAAAVSASIRNNRDVSIELELTLGVAAVRFWTCDLTTEYVRLNADYTT